MALCKDLWMTNIYIAYQIFTRKNQLISHEKNQKINKMIELNYFMV